MKRFEKALNNLEVLAEDILSEIDGGEELHSRDSQLSAWAADIENSVTLLNKNLNLYMDTLEALEELARQPECKTAQDKARATIAKAKGKL